MALQTKNLERVFFLDNKGKKITLQDPDPKLTVEAVMNYHSNAYPELTTAKFSGPKINNDKVEYTFSPVVGTKG